MTTLSSKLAIIGTALLLCAGSGNGYAQSAAVGAVPSCFAIHVSLNGELMDGPHTLTFMSRTDKDVQNIEHGCFRIPDDVLKDKSVDVSFDVGRNRIFLPSIDIVSFAGPWDVELEDKKFPRYIQFPKHTKAKKACAVVFHIGDPELLIAQMLCRTPL